MKLGEAEAERRGLTGDFPGYFAGASLKLLAWREYRDAVAGTSPATSPGPH